MESTSVRVMTWNLWGKGHNETERMHVILKTLQKVKPDIIAMQEVWAPPPGTISGQASTIAEALGYHFHFATASTGNDHYNYRFGNAIFARWPIWSHGDRELPGSNEGFERRVAVHAVISSPFGLIPVITSHLSWERNLSHVRKAQVSMLVEIANDLSSPGWPPILMGDFNSDPDSDEIRGVVGKTTVPLKDFVFQDAWEQGGDGSTGYTWTPSNSFYETTRHSSLPAMPWLRRRIDYIFVGLPDGRPDQILPIQVNRTWLEGLATSTEHEGSDHYAVVTDLGLR